MRAVSILLAALLFPQTSILQAVTTPSPGVVLAEMKKVADWQMANPSMHPVNDWTYAPYLEGLIAIYNITREPSYLNALKKAGEGVEWKPGPRKYTADDYAVCQAYCELYLMMRDPQMIAPTRAAFDFILEHPKNQPMDYDGLNGVISTERWVWCDALFMGPASWERLWAATGDRRYLDFMDREWWATADFLYDPAEGLMYRDSRFFKQKTANGKKIFWSRGNGWVLAGLARVLEYLPQDYPSRPRYVKLFKEMSTAIVTAQSIAG